LLSEASTPLIVLRDAMADFLTIPIIPPEDEEELKIPLQIPLADDSDPVIDFPRIRREARSRNIPNTRVLRSSTIRALSACPVDSIIYNPTRDPKDTFIASALDPSTPILEHNCTDLTEFNNESYAFGAKITVNNALKSDNKTDWRECILKEINQLLDTGTLIPQTHEYMSSLPAYKLINSTMQLKLKLKQDGSIDKYKARLCARGDQLHGTITETYSPTISALAYSTVHQLAIYDNMHATTIDVTGAYLYQDYPADALPLFLTLPNNVSEACGLNINTVYRVNKYLYGLPDAGLAFYKAYSELLINNNYNRSQSDPCLFIKLNGNRRTYLWIHVDDTFIVSTHPEELLLLEKVMRTKFQITVNPNVSDFLGVHYEILPNKEVQLTQPKLLQTLFDEFEILLNNITQVPTAPQQLNAQQDKNTTPCDTTKYLHLLGALIYLCKSRPDISTAVSFGATHAASPTMGHYNELIRCLAYLRGTRHHGLIIKRGNPAAPLKLRCYVDASYLTHDDSKSHTGYCLSFGHTGTFYSKSSKQTLVATSSTHAEIRALYALTIDVIYIINLCEELGRPISLPAIIMEDNQPSINITANIATRVKRCKHFVMLVNYIREQIVNNYIALQKIATEHNLADVLTKIVVGQKYTNKATDLLGM
jgi:hypothetical protein